jgi:polyphosphate kinase 2 (PPK2 family)
MFESAELGHTIDKQRWKDEVPKLREALLAAQYRVLDFKKFPVILVIGGVDGAGKGETVNLLSEWMDPRHLEVHATGAPTDEERERPAMWRFWRQLPPKGKIGIFFGSWYTEPIVSRVYGQIDDAELERRTAEIVRFEKMLADEGALILKFWFHLSKKAQKHRLKDLEKDPKTRWRVTDQEWKHFKIYDDFRPVSERTLRETNKAEAPWVVIEGADARYRGMTAGQTLLDAIDARLAREVQRQKEKEAQKAAAALAPKVEEPAPAPAAAPAPAPAPEPVKAKGKSKKGNGKADGASKPPVAVEVLEPDESTTSKKRAKAKGAPKVDLARANLLESLDLTQKVAKESYEKELEKLQRRLNLLSRDPKFRKMSTALVFEGMDAAGKGGSVRRVTSALDARYYSVIPVAAPTEEERAQPYLWRFWRHLPRRGRVTIFDRSWYGRVLVERVEGFAPVQDWMRAYSEINDFEEDLVRANTVVCKFWLHISSDEQLRRFKEREATGFKKFKITEEDWRNRGKAPLYDKAVCDMVDKTSTEIAPWTLVEAEDKYFARLKILRTICERVEAAM